MKEEIKNSNNKENMYKTMLSYCLKCRKNTQNKNKKVVRARNGRIMLLSKCAVYTRYKMNETVNKFLLAGDKFMSEMNLRQPGFTYSACGPFTKNKERKKNLKKQEMQDIFIKTN